MNSFRRKEWAVPAVQGDLADQAVALIKKNAKLIAKRIRKNVRDLNLRAEADQVVLAVFLVQAAVPAKKNAKLIVKKIRKNARILALQEAEVVFVHLVE